MMFLFSCIKKLKMCQLRMIDVCVSCGEAVNSLHY